MKQSGYFRLQKRTECYKRFYCNICAELEDHAHSLDDEAERLQKDFMIRRHPRAPLRARPSGTPIHSKQYHPGPPGPHGMPNVPRNEWRGGGQAPLPPFTMNAGPPSEGPHGPWRGGSQRYGSKRPREY